MSAREVDLTLPFWVNGTLSEAERAEFEAAMAEDPRLSAEAEALAAIRAGMQAEELRSPGEFEDGAYEGAKLVPHTEIGSRLAEIESWLGGDKTKPVVVYCRSGRRSGIAARELENLGGHEAVIEHNLGLTQ